MCYLVEAQEVPDGGGGVEDVAFSRHHQHEAAQRLEREEASLRAPCCASSHPPGLRSYLEQQVALVELHSVDGGHLGEGGGGRRDVSPKHEAPLAGAVLAFLHGGWREKENAFTTRTTTFASKLEEFISSKM